MGKFWSLVFLSLTIFGIACFVWAPYAGHWLPRDISEHGHVIDHLFWFILILTGLVFVGTEGAQFYFMWRYNAETNTEPAKFTHGSHTLEVVWTVLPAATLLFIAIYQMQAWADAKISFPQLGNHDIPSSVEVTARQFEWRIRYARTKVEVEGGHGEDGHATGGYTFGPDDVFLVNDLRVPVNEEIVLDLKSMDVLHSFFLPNLRVKQDAVPGMKIPVWFKAKETGTYDLVCAELCGWGHYKMKGRLTVMNRDEFDAWLDQQQTEQGATE